MSEGKHFDSGKSPVELVPTSATFALAEILESGKAKYGPRNWEQGIAWSRVYASAIRHLLRWFNGEDLDPESGRSHLKHALCNVAFLVEYLETHPELDDRPKCQTAKSTEIKPLTAQTVSTIQNVNVTPTSDIAAAKSMNLTVDDILELDKAHIRVVSEPKDRIQSPALATYRKQQEQYKEQAKRAISAWIVPPSPEVHSDH
jgi:hypothetical protein